MKKLLALGTILGAAALLQNKDRRDRLMKGAHDLLDNVRRRSSSLASSTGTEAGTGKTTDEPLFTESELGGQRAGEIPGYNPGNSGGGSTGMY